MPLQPGAAFGPYRIVAPIGAGGMGEVYRAHDPRLNRDVALKFLRPEFSADADRLQRFVREAQTLAALNHPHIAQLYGVEDAPDGGSQVRALVMEFVDGEDLSARLRRGPIPVDEALEIAQQVAMALEAAHDQGIVHRDLKPANIKIRPDGSVKVLDLGLAKALTSATASSSPGALADSPTFTSPAVTAANVILGTAAYMSPEQARGKSVDKRADIWAFGVVLYEMLTGGAAFRGETTTELLAGVVTREPEWGALPPSVPLEIRRLLQRCLQKDPRLRLRDIGEARIALSHPAASAVAIAAPEQHTGRQWVAAFLPWAIALIAIAAGAWGWMTRPTSSAPLRKFELALPGPRTGPTVVLSPDGTRVAYRVGDRIAVHDLERLKSTDLVASVASQRNAVFWSPDSAFIGYNDADAKLWIVPAAGGTPRQLCTIPDSGQLLGATWHTADAITFSVWRGSLYSVSSSGGNPAVVLKADPKNEVDFHQPVVLPDGRLLVVTHFAASGSRPDRLAVELVDKNRREPATGDQILPLAYSKSGHILAQRVDANVGLWAVPYSGQFPLKIEEGFLIAPGASFASEADDGSLLYTLPSTASDMQELVWVDRLGKTIGTIGASQLELGAPALSPDGRRVAYVALVGNSTEVWVRDLETNADTRVTFDTVNQLRPTWVSPGGRIVYREDRAIGSERIVSSAADGSGVSEELTTGMNPEVSPDGRYLAYLVAAQGPAHLRVAPLPAQGRAGEATVFLRRTPDPLVAESRFSPDGRLIAYVEEMPGGSSEIFLTRFPSAEGRWQVSRGGGRSPAWASASEIVFASGSGSGPQAMMSVAVGTGATPSVGAPVKLFDFAPDLVGRMSVGRSFDVSRDGRRFVMVRANHPGSSLATERRWVLVQNWLTEFASPSVRSPNPP